MPYAPTGDRYRTMTYARCGRSGLRLPAISLGLWQNFGADRSLERREFSAAELAEIDRYATESGINIWAASSAG